MLCVEVDSQIPVRTAGGSGQAARNGSDGSADTVGNSFEQN